MSSNSNYEPYMPLTLEQHFKVIAENYPEVVDLHSLWLLLRKDLEDRLPHSRNIFVHYSLHDATHSRSVIHAIERFLGEERISQLSATDTFMLLSCAYTHDYGMAMTFNQIYDALGEKDFFDFLDKQKKKLDKLEEEEARAVKNLIAFAQEARIASNLQDMYFSIMVVIQLYLRPTHWKRVSNVWDDFSNLLNGRLNSRFIQGGQGILDICEAHGRSFKDLMKMNIRADGIIGDDFHPRFIAAMLRLGDLLDLDNGRFPRWFVTEIGRNRGIIPQLSKLHYKKHEAITHLLITPKGIEVCAACDNNESGYEVASIVSEWLEWLEKECTDQILHWSEIIPGNFGSPPRVSQSQITLDGKLFTANNRQLQMRMPQERVMKLLEGTNIYKNQYVGIRELVQNAIDASLLQLWDDITHNRYVNIGINKRGHQIKEKYGEQEEGVPDEEKREMKLLEHGTGTLDRIFNNYEITVELIQDMVDERVYIVVKDKGIGITPEDARFMSDIGSSKENNERIVEIMKNMPRWLKPSGVFGIGLQSVFQLTDRIEFYTRRPNEPERLIVFHSYGRNCGKIEIREVKPETEGIYFDNAVPGTNVKIAIDPRKLLISDNEETKDADDHLLYYDMKFDCGNILHAMYVELSQVIRSELQAYPCDYFNVYFQQIKRYPEKKIDKGRRRRMRYSYFSPNQDRKTKDKNQLEQNENSIRPFRAGDNMLSRFSFNKERACYIDEQTSWIYKITVRSGKIEQVNGQRLFYIPEPVQNLYHFQYKFNPLSDSSAIYPSLIRQMRKVHAGFLTWDINIMDDQPEKYLNIDRDRLRDGAISEKALSIVRNAILLNWCEFLINQYQAEQSRVEKENRKLEHTDNFERADESTHQVVINLYEDCPETLISLALLFYQNVPDETFRKFIQPYSDFLDKQNLILANESFRVDKLWQDKALFKSIVDLPITWKEEFRETEKENPINVDYELKGDTISRLPHRLIHITNISLNDSLQLCYHFQLGRSYQEPFSINMDYAARLQDYSGALFRASSGTSALIRIVFKPNRMYQNLVVSQYPKDFRRGNNFSSPLDHCIRWYILSPIDQELAKWLNPNSWGKREKEEIMTEVRKKIENYVKKSNQFEKCVQYVLKQKEIPKGDNEKLRAKEKIIRDEYKAFLQDCCKM